MRLGGGYFGSFWMSLLRESCRECRSSAGVVLGDLVDVADCGSKIVLCISEQIYMLRGVEWLRADVYAACSVCVGGLS